MYVVDKSIIEHRKTSTFHVTSPDKLDITVIYGHRILIPPLYCYIVHRGRQEMKKNSLITNKNQKRNLSGNLKLKCCA